MTYSNTDSPRWEHRGREGPRDSLVCDRRGVSGAWPGAQTASWSCPHPCPGPWPVLSPPHPCPLRTWPLSAPGRTRPRVKAMCYVQLQLHAGSCLLTSGTLSPQHHLCPSACDPQRLRRPSLPDGCPQVAKMAALPRPLHPDQARGPRAPAAEQTPSGRTRPPTPVCSQDTEPQGDSVRRATQQDSPVWPLPRGPGREESQVIGDHPGSRV